jgi:transcriptional regulator with XRE-family HTH domain
MKKIDYHLLVRELLEGLFLSQQDLADRCKVSQQSISNWKNRTRNPGIFAKKKICELAEKEKIDIRKYETDDVRDAIARHLEKDNGRELLRIFELYQKMSRRDQVKLLKYSNDLSK